MALIALFAKMTRSTNRSATTMASVWWQLRNVTKRRAGSAVLARRRIRSQPRPDHAEQALCMPSAWLSRTDTTRAESAI